MFRLFIVNPLVNLKKRNEEKKRLKRKLEVAYKKVAEEDYELYKEWEDTLGDGLEE